jgi:type 1 fimbria pilin
MPVNWMFHMIPIARNVLIWSLFANAALSAAAGKQTFTGTITDSMCADKAGHSQMRMGATDAECAMACIDAHGASYVLFDGKNVYSLSDQRAPEKFAGQRVRVTGTLDAKTRTIQVDSITAAK